MDHITLNINGTTIETTPGKTILEVINENDIDVIPTLCYDERLEPYGSCFLCSVEVEGMSRLVPSCATPVSQGMVIHTNSRKVKESRKAVIELLMSNHYADCIGPCINNCPAGVDVQGYIALISMGRYEEAVRLIRQSNPLPLSTGRICVRNCEDACRRCYVDDPIAINFLKRFAADNTYFRREGILKKTGGDGIDGSSFLNRCKPEIKKKNWRKVAIIGAGPAGLTCAYYLALEGYSPVIFEKLPKPGGMLRYGIPGYRLPKSILDAEIKAITDLGVIIRTNIELGRELSIDSLMERGYEAVYLGVGAHKASSMGLEGENFIEGIYKGIDFLREIQLSRERQIIEKKLASRLDKPVENELDAEHRLYGTVVVVGGGNTAIDAARTSLRCGAGKVIIVYRRSINEMPAHPAEVQAARDEGVEIMFLTNPKSLVSENGRLKAIECLRMELVSAGPNERPKPVPVEGSEFILECDHLISAIGQQVDESFMEKDREIKLEKWGTIKVNTETFETSVKGVFAGGDVVSGALTAVNAIGHGRKAARAIDEYLRNGEAKAAEHKFYSFRHRFGQIPESDYANVRKSARENMHEIDIEDRMNNFREIETGFSEGQAENESLRCLGCGCQEYYDCQLRKYADELEIDINNYLGEVRKFRIDSRHPLISFDPNKCINCGKCVRTCTEILTVPALGFVSRGFKAVVRTAMEKPLQETNCISCGNCIDVCPTGAISEKLPFRALGTMPKTNHRTICNFCSLGCNVNFKVINDELFYVSNSTNEIIDSGNEGYLCARGRFGYRALLENNRFDSAAIRINGMLRNTSIDMAISQAGARLKEIINKYGPGSVAVFASPRMTNEELYLLQKFARIGLKTNNVASLSNLVNGVEHDALDDEIGATVSTITIQDMAKSDVIIVMNASLTEENLIMELKIKQARKNGAKVILVSSCETEMNQYADVWLDARKGTGAILIKGFINEAAGNDVVNFYSPDVNRREISTIQPFNHSTFKSISNQTIRTDPETIALLTGTDREKYARAVEMIKDSRANITFVYNLDSLREKSRNDLKMICRFMRLTGRLHRENNGIIILREFTNSVGLQDMGVSPAYLPGYVRQDEKEEVERLSECWESDLKPVFHPVDILSEMQKGNIKAVLVFGEDPLSNTSNLKYFRGVEFLLVMDAFRTETSSAAEVIIPASGYLEQTGTYTSCDTMIQKSENAVNKKNSFDNWEIIKKLAEKFSQQFSYDSADDIFAEIVIVNRLYKNCRIGDYWNKKEQARNFFIDRYKPSDLDSSYDMTTFNPAKPIMHYSDDYYQRHIKSKL